MSLKIIENAIENVDLSFQEISVVGEKNKPEIIIRERVWCYEFYHQIRKLGIENINGEIDKRGHRIIKNNCNPDFVIHKEGSMTENEAVIEVKLVKRNIIKDLKTLATMIALYKYKLGIFILINYNLNSLENYLKTRKLEKIVKTVEDKIYIFTKDKEGKIETETLKNILKN